jgi:hypothetical protein
VEVSSAGSDPAPENTTFSTKAAVSARMAAASSGPNSG